MNPPPTPLRKTKSWVKPGHSKKSPTRIHEGILAHYVCHGGNGPLGPVECTHLGNEHNRLWKIHQNHQLDWEKT